MIAQESILPPGTNKALIEDNLLIGLSTNNIGLQRSSALLLGKIQSEKAVIPLMKAFHNNPNEKVRIAVAWALCKIGDARGVYAVKMAVKYDECPRVQMTCAWYYDNFVQQGTFSFTQPEEPMIAHAK
jgi:FOG: HEAT repeat